MTVVRHAFALVFAALCSVHCAASPRAASPRAASPPAVAPQPETAAASFTCPFTTPPGGGARVHYDKACSRDDDCAWVRQPTCCGAVRALGVRKGEEAKVTGGCPSCPPLACVYGPLVTEDTATSADFQGGKDVEVACVQSLCATRVRR